MFAGSAAGSWTHERPPKDAQSKELNGFYTEGPKNLRLSFRFHPFAAGNP